MQPLVMWLWIGGGLAFGGTLLAAFPGQRRRVPTAPASEAVPGAGPPPEHELIGAEAGR